MTGFVFAILLALNFLLFPCEGKIFPPDDGNTSVVLPGGNVTIAWKIDPMIPVSDLKIRQWQFVPIGKTIADIVANGNVTIKSTFFAAWIEIIKPSTLVLKNVDKRFNGKYQFEIRYGAMFTQEQSEVEVFVAVTPMVSVSCSSSITLDEGDDVACECKGEGGNPPADVTWYKDNVLIMTGKEKVILRFPNVNKDDSGTYRCEAKSGHEKAKNETTIELIVNYKPINTTIMITPQEAEVDSPVTIMCNSAGGPEPSYNITHDGTVLDTTGKTHSISKVKWSDAGTYTCIAWNRLGSYSASANLTVDPIMLPRDGNYLSFSDGSDAKIVWSLDPSLSTTTIYRSWSFKSNGIGEDEFLGNISRAGNVAIPTKLYEVAIEEPATLVLKNVNESYNGTYVFTVLSPGRSTSEVDVFIAKTPNVTINCPSHITLDEGKSRTCVCTSKNGNPPADVTWYKDGVQVGENILNLISVTKQNIGTYKCVAKSHNLTDEESIEVEVRLNYIPEGTEIEIKPEEVDVGDRVTITCSSTGRPEPHFTITHDGNEVVTGKLHNIAEAKESDKGTYTCIATNTLGSHSASRDLRVHAIDKHNPVAETKSCGWWCILLIVIAVLLMLMIIAYVVYRHKQKEKEGGYRGNADVSPGASAGIPVNHYELDEGPDGGVDNAYDTVNNPGASGSKSKPPENTTPDVYAAVDKKNREGKPLYATLDSLALQADNSKKKRGEERPGQTEYASIDFAKIGKVDEE